MTTKPVIQVGVDNSWRDAGALEWALQEALLRGEALQVVHVIDDRAPAVPDQPTIELAGEVGKYLDERLGVLDHHARVVVGPPARTLADLAADSRMLVVGRRGTGVLRGSTIGSLSEALAIGATVPVVVVPQHWGPADHAGPVLVAVDGSDSDSAAVGFAAEAALLRTLPLRLVHVWNLPGVYAGDVPSIGEEWWATAARRVESLADALRVRHPELIVESEIRSGHSTSGVVAAVAETDAQLLVIGGCSRDWPSTLPDSVTRSVLRHADCPLAVVHDPAA